MKKKLRNDWRGTLVTTVQSFQQMGDLAPRDRDNIISLIDECHRSQKGQGTESYAMTMRVKLPKGFRYEVLVMGDIPEPVYLQFSPDGRLWFTGRRGDIWAADWSGYELVYLFQRPESMARALSRRMA